MLFRTEDRGFCGLFHLFQQSLPWATDWLRASGSGFPQRLCDSRLQRIRPSSIVLVDKNLGGQLEVWIIHGFPLFLNGKWRCLTGTPNQV